MKTLAIASHKGGQAKTTITAHLAWAASLVGKRVLMIDGDTQGSLSILFHSRPADPAYLCVSDLFAETLVDKPVKKIDSHLSILAADANLSNFLSMTGNIEHARQALARLAPHFDLCLMDTPPERNAISMCELALADFVISPAELGLLELAGVAELFATVQAVRSTSNKNLQHLGIVCVKTNTRSAVEKATIAGMREAYGAFLFERQLPRRESVKSAINNRKPVWSNPRGDSHIKAANEMHDFCNLLLNKIFTTI